MNDYTELTTGPWTESFSRPAVPLASEHNFTTSPINTITRNFTILVNASSIYNEASGLGDSFDDTPSGRFDPKSEDGWYPSSPQEPLTQTQHVTANTHPSHGTENAEVCEPTSQSRKSAAKDHDTKILKPFQAANHPATFQCNLCPKWFTRAYNLRSHLRTHADELPIACQVCGKAFARQRDCKRHEGYHFRKKKFVCKGDLISGSQWGCDRSFTRADALGRHFRSEAGRVCIKPLLDQEMLRCQKVWSEQRQAATQLNLAASESRGDHNSLLEHARNSNMQPEPLLAQYFDLLPMDSGPSNEQIYKQLASVLPIADDKPFTDSGYESMPNPELATHILPALGESAAIAAIGTMNTIDEDAQTVYTGATLSVPDFTSTAISDICRDIFTKIQHYVSAENWSLISSNFSWLIKGFAVKIGLGASTDLDRRIMYFVHRHHQQIASRLKSLFEHLNNDNEARQHTSNSMSLSDKMELWGRKLVHDNLQVEELDLFEGVEDEKDDDAEDLRNPVVSTYGKTIMSSTAYKWLISSLLKETSFHWDESQPRTMLQTIRQPILEKLPKGTISRRRSPPLYTVKFLLPWPSIQSRIEQEHTDKRTGPRRPLSGFTVMTGSSAHQVQVTTVKQYLSQTWTSGGKPLLDAIQRVVDGSYEYDNSALSFDQNEIKAALAGKLLTVTVIGPATCIAECGEQLSWLGAALQPSRPDQDVYSTPCLSTCEVDRTNPNSLQWTIGLENEINDQRFFEGMHIEPGVLQSVIVRGFPTRRRPGLCDGLEIATEMLFDLVEAPTLMVYNDNILLQGLKCTLGLIRRTDDLLVWHVLSFPSHFCPRSLNSGLILATAIFGLTTLSDLCTYRQVIETCELDRSSDWIVQATPSTEIPESNVPSKHTENKSPSTSCIATSPQDSCLDSDMLSMSDTSKPFSSFDDLLSPRDDVRTLKGAVAIRLLSDYRKIVTTISDTCKTAAVTITATTPRDHGGCTDDNCRSSAPTNQTVSTSQGTCKGPRKRNHTGDDNDEGEENEDDKRSMPPSKRARRGRAECKSKLLACPFWKHDPIKHRGCFNSKLNKISRVKQHISRKHTPLYCECCLAVFSEAEGHQRHVRYERCLWDPSAELDGVTHQQQQQLSRKSNPDLSESDKWFVIWSVVFPNKTRPSSAYIDPELSADLCQFREYSQSRGPPILLEELQNAGMMSASDILRASILQGALGQGLDRLHEEWLLNRPSTAVRTIDTNSGSTQASHERTTVESMVDSGIASSSLDTFSERLQRNASPRAEYLVSQRLDTSSIVARDHSILADGISIHGPHLEEPSVQGHEPDGLQEEHFSFNTADHALSAPYDWQDFDFDAFQ